MDPYLLTLAGEAGAAVVALLVGEAWQQTRDGIVTVWQRYRPQGTDEVGRELDASRRTLLSAAESGDAEAGEGLAREWAQRIAGLLGEHPRAAEELRTLLAQLASAPPRQAIRGDVRLEARASGNASVYQSMGDQHITQHITEP
ncbi:hypothetical protein ACWC09_39125 [Streptomyces sp. NPDC001617]